MWEAEVHIEMVAFFMGRGKFDSQCNLKGGRWRFLTVFALELAEIAENCPKRPFGEARVNFLLCSDDQMA